MLRLAFCGGFDIARDNVIEEAAAVAGLDPAAAVAAARATRATTCGWTLPAAGCALRGIVSPPAISIGTSWFDGPDAVIAAVSFSVARARLGAPGTPIS